MELRERVARLSGYVWGPISILVFVMPQAVMLIWLTPEKSQWQANVMISLLLVAMLLMALAILGFELRLITLWRRGAAPKLAGDSVAARAPAPVLAVLAAMLVLVPAVPSISC